MLNSLSDLHGYIDKGQLTCDLGGTLDYCHSQWIHHRTVRKLKMNVIFTERQKHKCTVCAMQKNAKFFKSKICNLICILSVQTVLNCCALGR